MDLGPFILFFLFIFRTCICIEIGIRYNSPRTVYGGPGDGRNCGDRERIGWPQRGRRQAQEQALCSASDPSITFGIEATHMYSGQARAQFTGRSSLAPEPGGIQTGTWRCAVQR